METSIFFMVKSSLLIVKITTFYGSIPPSSQFVACSRAVSTSASLDIPLRPLRNLRTQRGAWNHQLLHVGLM